MSTLSTFKMRSSVIIIAVMILQLGYSQSTVSIYELDAPPVAPGCENLQDHLEIENCTQKYLELVIAQKLDSLAQHQIVAVDGIDKMAFWININSEGEVTHLTYRSGSTEETRKDLFRELQKLPPLQPGKKEGKSQGVRLIVDYIPINNRQ